MLESLHCHRTNRGHPEILSLAHAPRGASVSEDQIGAGHVFLGMQDIGVTEEAKSTARKPGNTNWPTDLSSSDPYIKYLDMFILIGKSNTQSETETEKMISI